MQVHQWPHMVHQKHFRWKTISIFTIALEIILFLSLNVFILISIHLKTANALQQTPQREILMGT